MAQWCFAFLPHEGPVPPLALRMTEPSADNATNALRSAAASRRSLPRRPLGRRGGGVPMASAEAPESPIGAHEVGEDAYTEQPLAPQMWPA